MNDAHGVDIHSVIATDLASRRREPVRPEFEASIAYVRAPGALTATVLVSLVNSLE